MRISHEAIYQWLYIQGRGALKRELVWCLRTGRALRAPRERSRRKTWAHFNTFISLDLRDNVCTLTNYGTGNSFQGVLKNLVDNGVMSRITDLNVNTRDSGARQGSGSPEGVVTADPGVRYVDTLVTNGALEWTKMSGSGNTGWKVTKGDTGWRLVVAAGAFAGRTTSQVKVRRINDEVEVQLYEAASGGVAGTHTLYDFGSTTQGFRAGTVGGPSMCITNAGAPLAGSVLYVSGWLVVLKAATTDVHRALSRYSTADAWPAVLPGTATTG